MGYFVVGWGWAMKQPLHLVLAGVLGGALISVAVMPAVQHLLPSGFWVSFTGVPGMVLNEETNCPQLVVQRTVNRDVNAWWAIQPYELQPGGEWSSAGYSERSGFLRYEVSDPPEFAAPINFWRGDTPVDCSELDGAYRVEVTVQLDPPFFRPHPVRLLSEPITYGDPR